MHTADGVERYAVDDSQLRHVEDCHARGAVRLDEEPPKSWGRLVPVGLGEELPENIVVSGEMDLLQLDELV